MKNKNGINGKMLIFLISLMMMSIGLVGQQNDFFSIRPIPQDLSSGKLQFVNNLAQDEKTKSMACVEFDNLTEHLQADGKISLKVLTEQNRFDITPVHYELKENGDYVWLGKLSEGNGYAALIKTNNYLAGFVQTQNNFWEIVPLKEGTSIVRKLDLDKFENESCGIDKILENYTEAELQEVAIDLCGENKGCGGIIDVLVLVPDDVRNWYGSEFDNYWEAYFHAVISLHSFQFALINSGIENISLRFTTQRFGFNYTFPLNPERDIFTTLPNSASALREEYRADLVVLLTSMNYPGVRGISKPGNIVDNQFEWEAPCEDCAYVIVEVQNSVAPTWTFAHELAHLFSSRHNRSDNVPCEACGDDTDVCTHGWRFDSIGGGQDRTILSNLFNNDIANGSQRALHFSNPEIQFNGFDTGTDENNNSIGISNAACEVQNFFPPAVWGVTISGSGLLCSPEEGSIEAVTYTANVLEPIPNSSGMPPYTYEWRWNTDGNFTEQSPGYLIGTDSQIEISTAYNCPRFFLRVTVSSSDGRKERATRVVRTEYCKSCNQFLRNNNNTAIDNTIVFSKENEDKNSRSFSKYTIYPNPTDSKIIIKRPDDLSGNFQIKVYNTFHRVLQEVFVEKDFTELDLSQYRGQSVWVHIQDEKTTYIQKVVIINE